MPENKVVEKVEKQQVVISRVNNKLKIFLAFLPNILINLFAIIALALITLIAFNFDADYILSWAFVITTGLLLVIYVSVHWATFDAKVKALRRNKDNIEYWLAQEQDIKKVTNTVVWANHKHEFLGYRNQDQKIVAWKTHITNQLTKLSNKASRKDLFIETQDVTPFQRKNLTEEQVKELEAKYDEQKSKCRYLKRKAQLEGYLEDKWIANNINKISIEFNEVDIQFIETGSVIKGITKDKTQKKGKYAKDNTVSRVVSIILTLFISAFTADLGLSHFTPDAWFVFTIRMFLLVVNITMGLNYGETYYAELDIHNVDSRNMTTDEFKIWVLEKGYTS